MRWKQVRTPRLGTTDRVGYCLRYARKFFGIGVTIPTAWLSWKANRTKHKNKNFPKGVAVPLWWKYYLGGVNFGHVAIRMPNGKIYSSPYKSGQGRFIASSISQLERIYGLSSYVGWTETINGRRVVKKVKKNKAMKPTKSEIGNAFNFLGVPDKKVGSKKYKHYGSRREKSLYMDVLRALYKKFKNVRKQRDNSRKELKKTRETLQVVKENLANLKADDIQDEQRKEQLESVITGLQKDLDIAERKAMEDDDTNEKVNALYNYFYERWQTFKDFIKSKE